MNNKIFLFVTFLLVLCNLTSFAQVRIEVVPPFIEGGGDARWENRNSADSSISEDVFELKNGRTIRGNLESFSGGVYFVNIGGVLKSIPENTISKINGQALSAVKATVPDSVTADVKVIHQNIYSLIKDSFDIDLICLKNGKLRLGDKLNRYYAINGNNNFAFFKRNGAIYRNDLIKKNKDEHLYDKFDIPIMIDANGVYCLKSRTFNPISFEKYEDVYYYRYGANNLEGPVAKCENPYLETIGYLHFSVIDNLGFPELAIISSGNRREYTKLIFYKSVRMNNGLFALKNKYSYDFRKKPDNEDTKNYGYINNGIEEPTVGYGSFFDSKKKNWIVIYHNTRCHRVTNKWDSELYIDVFDEDVSKGVAKSFHFIIPAVYFTNGGYGNNSSPICLDVDRDGITELFFQGDTHGVEKPYCVIVKLKDSNNSINSKKK